MNFAGSADQMQDRSHHERLLKSRMTFEYDDVKERGVFDGAVFKGMMQTIVNNELLYAYHWTVWKYGLTLQIIFPNQYPIVPPLVRVTANSGCSIKHPKFDSETGFIIRHFGEDQPWSPEITVWSMFVTVMDILAKGGLPEFERPEEKPYVRGDYRHNLPLTYDEYHSLANTFGTACFQQLERKYVVKFELRGGIRRSKQDSRYLFIACDRDGIFPTVVSEIQNFIAERRKQVEQGTVFVTASAKGSISKCEPPPDIATACSADSMKGVKKSSAEEPVPAGRGRGRGRGRARFPICDPPGRTPPGLQNRDDAAPAGQINNQNGQPPQSPDNLSVLKQMATSMLQGLVDSCAARFVEAESRLDSVHERLGELETSLAMFMSVSKVLTDQGRSQEEQLPALRAQVNELRNKWMCPSCGVPDNKLVPEKRSMVLECGHMFCEPCGHNIRLREVCLCGEEIVEVITMFL